MLLLSDKGWPGPARLIHFTCQDFIGERGPALTPGLDSTESKRLFARKVLSWYRTNGRRLPWRNVRDPYRIWVSEVMLQQTQVASAIRYYERFLQAFPSVTHLAEADLQEVLKQWEGMGYYARARNLHQSARLIMERHKGLVPDQMGDLLSLPGIGRSTAGAILSIAFNQQAPILDGNVQRLLCRIYAVREDPRQARVSRLLWQLSEGILPERQAGPLNQGLMDIGALVCTPKTPSCPGCPLPSFCQAFHLNAQDRIPQPRRALPLPHREKAVAVIWWEGRVLLCRRPSPGLLGGLWEFPGWHLEGTAPARPLLSQKLAEECGLSVELEEEILSFLHAYTHFREGIQVFHGRCRKPGRASRADLQWVRTEELERYPLSASQRRIADFVNDRTRAESISIRRHQ